MAGGNFVTMGPIPDQEGGLLQVKNCAVNIQNAIPSTVIPAVSGKRIYVHASFISTNSTPAFNILEVTTAGATVTNFTGSGSSNFQITNNTVFTLPYQQYPWFTCAAGNAFAFSSTSGNTIFCGGSVMYIQA